MKTLSILILLLTAATCFAQANWDTTAIFNPATLDVDTLWTRDTTVQYIDFTVGEIRFNSAGDVGETIRIQAFFANPHLGAKPIVVVGHGIGGAGSLSSAMAFSIAVQGCALAISGPGRGASEGQDSDPLNWIRTIPDERNSWIYQYAYAGMRGMTYLQTLPDMDHAWAGYVGVSAGGIMTYLASAVDTRCTYSIVMLANGSWASAVDCPNAWFFQVITAGDSIAINDPRILRLVETLDPIQYCDRHNVPSLVINAAQDEFFPINALVNHWACYGEYNKRLLVIANFDHGIYYTDDPEYAGRYDAFDNTARFEDLSLRTLATWFVSLKNDIDIPSLPTVDANYTGTDIEFTCHAAIGYTGTVQMWVSTDTGWTYQNTVMSRLFAGLPWECSVPVPAGCNLSNVIYFAEASGASFTYTSVPWVPLPPKLRPGPDVALAIPPSALPEALALRVSPNPVRGSCVVEAAAGCPIGIYGIDGRLVASLRADERLWTPGDGVANGVYVVRAVAGDGRTSEKKVVLLLR